MNTRTRTRTQHKHKHLSRMSKVPTPDPIRLKIDAVTNLSMEVTQLCHDGSQGWSASDVAVACTNFRRVLRK